MRIRVTQEVCSLCGTLGAFHKPYYTKPGARVMICHTGGCQGVTEVGTGFSAGRLPVATVGRRLAYLAYEEFQDTKRSVWYRVDTVPVSAGTVAYFGFIGKRF